MIVKTEMGRTEVRFESFNNVNPKCELVRIGYRQACIDKPNDIDKHKSRVREWCKRNFGQEAYLAAFESFAGEGSPIARLAAWSKWIEANPGEIKRYYDSAVVAECIMGEDE